MLGVLAVLTPGCSKKDAPGDDRTRAVASAAPDAAVAARLVAQPKHDFGHVTQGDTLRHAFASHNSTGAPLRVEDTLEVLGCAAVAAPGVLEPGGSGKLEVTCRASVPGPLRVSLPLRANGRPSGELFLSGNVEPLLAFDRALVDLTMPFGEERSMEVRLRGKRAHEARLTPAAAPPPNLTATLLPASPGTNEGVIVRSRGASVGTHVGSLRYHTGLSEPPEVSLSYVVKVLGTLDVSPTNPVLELGVPGPKRVVVKVTSTQPGFAVTGAEVLEGPFTARVRRSESGFDVEITAIEAKLAAGMRGVNGRVRIVSNDRTERTKEIPLFALGAPFGGAQPP